MDRAATPALFAPSPIRRWHKKAAIDGLKSLIPFQDAVRRLKRKFFPYETQPDRDRELVEDARDQLLKLAELGVTIEGATVVEIGTGWNPVLPLMLRLYGAGKVITVDQERLLDRCTVRTGIASLSRMRALFEERLAAVGFAANFEVLKVSADTGERTLFDCTIDYRAPADFRQLSDRMADIIISRDVLEHVPPELLTGLMAASHRILKDHGIICHKIDMTDHWEHLDKSISPINFLKYEGLGWKLAGLNRQNYQNRLRRFEFVEMAQRSGFNVIAAAGAPDYRALSALKTMPVISRYAAVPHDELAVLHTTLVARKQQV
jgi:cyclopropane fatty-acyl-phospholipid synthase-like methyltransferase